MRIRSIVLVRVAAALAGFLGAAAPAGAQQPVTIRAGTVLDGKGGVLRNAVVAVDGSRIVKVGNGAAETTTYDFPPFTVLPRMIDPHLPIPPPFAQPSPSSTPTQ